MGKPSKRVFLLVFFFSFFGFGVCLCVLGVLGVRKAKFLKANQDIFFKIIFPLL